MLKRTFLALFLVLIQGQVLAESQAKTDCPSPTVSWKDSGKHDVCIPNTMVSILTCLRDTGGGQLLVTETTDTLGKRSKTLDVIFGVRGPAIGGQGGINLDNSTAESLKKELTRFYHPALVQHCHELASVAPLETQAPMLSSQSFEPETRASIRRERVILLLDSPLKLYGGLQTGETNGHRIRKALFTRHDLPRSLVYLEPTFPPVGFEGLCRKNRP
jgi:hypothetical protein